jgi:hypothetical protein
MSHDALGLFFNTLGREVLLQYSNDCLAKQLADVDGLCFTTPHDRLVVNQMVVKSAADITLLASQHPNSSWWPIDQPRPVREHQLGVINGSLTSAAHTSLRAAMRHVQQSGRHTHELAAVAYTGHVALSCEHLPADEGRYPHFDEHTGHPALQWPDEPTCRHTHLLRMFQMVAPPSKSRPARVRADNYVECQGPASYQDAPLDWDTPELGPNLGELLNGHEILLPRPANNQPTDGSFRFDSSLATSYITEELVAWNYPYLSPTFCTGPPRYVEGHDGIRHPYHRYLSWVTIFIQDSYGAVKTFRHLEQLPVVSCAPGSRLEAWAGCLGADLLDWGCFYHHGAVVWRHGTPAEVQPEHVGAVVLTAPDAPGMELFVVATNIRRLPIDDNHPRLSAASQALHQRHLGTTVAMTGLPYIVGMCSVLGSLAAYQVAARRTVPISYIYHRHEDGSEEWRYGEISLLDGVYDRDDAAPLWASYGPHAVNAPLTLALDTRGRRLEATRLAFMQQLCALQRCQTECNPGTHSNLPLVSTNFKYLGYYEQDGCLYTCPFRTPCSDPEAPWLNGEGCPGPPLPAEALADWDPVPIGSNGMHIPNSDPALEPEYPSYFRPDPDCP